MELIRSSWGLLTSISPNRVAVYLTAAAGLLTALVPVAANLDLTSTVGVVAGFAGVAAVTNKWLAGWQQMEKVSQQNTLHELMTTREAAANAEARAQATQPRSSVRLPR